MKKGFKPLKYISIAVLAASLLGLVGCSHPDNTPVIVKTVAQQRQSDIHALKNQGVSVMTMGQTVKIFIPSDSLFVDGSSNLQQDYVNDTLSKIASYIKSFSTEHVSVAAYSDNRQPRSDPVKRKLALTDRQAQVVSTQLWSNGVDTRLMVAKGFGAKHSIAWNGSQTGRRDNRRVEISFRFYPNNGDVS